MCTTRCGRPGTLSACRKWVELGKIAQSGSVLRNLVGIVINNLVMNQIINMPRGSAKLYLFEELARLLATVPGAAEIVKQSYAQLRKYKCVAVTITQSAAQMTQSGVGQIVMTQSINQLFFLCPQCSSSKIIVASPLHDANMFSYVKSISLKDSCGKKCSI